MGVSAEGVRLDSPECGLDVALVLFEGCMFLFTSVALLSLEHKYVHHR